MPDIIQFCLWAQLSKEEENGLNKFVSYCVGLCPVHRLLAYHARAQP